MPIKFYISELTFSGGQKIPIKEDSIVVIVGPNNAGKSTVLRDVKSFTQPKKLQKSITSIDCKLDGTIEEFGCWLKENYTDTKNQHDVDCFRMGEIDYPVKELYKAWEKEVTPWLSNIFVQLVTGNNQHEAVQKMQSFDASKDPAITPIQKMFSDDKHEKAVNSYFNKAFGSDIFLNRYGGNKIPLQYGSCPPLSQGETFYSPAYLKQLKKYPLLEQQGDGMVSFTGAILMATSSPAKIMCFDEPELYLHPPQAYLLGRFFSRDIPTNKQMFLATHNLSFVQGLLSGDSDRINIIRIDREDNKNIANLLNNEDLKALWDEPILRYSNALSGIFHERVIVCESDADCHFYNALSTAIVENKEIPTPDILFVPTGGKHKVETVVKAMTAVGVPVSAICDIDVLDNETTISGIVQALGGNWDNYKKLYRSVKVAIEKKWPSIKSSQVKQKITDILNSLDSGDFPREKEKEIKDAMKETSAWKMAKSIGLKGLKGEGYSNAQELFTQFEEIGLFIIKVGEMESYVPSVSRHGPKWVSAVLEKDLVNDSELQDARKFISQVVFEYNGGGDI